MPESRERPQTGSLRRCKFSFLEPVMGHFFAMADPQRPSAYLAETALVAGEASRYQYRSQAHQYILHK